MTVSLPDEKRDKVLKWISYLESRRTCKILKYAQFIGLLTSACSAVKYGWLYTKLFEGTKYLTLQVTNGNYEASMSIPNSLSSDLEWGKNNIPSTHNNLKNDNFSLEIYTDANLSGWGAFCDGQSTCGWWNNSLKTKHIHFSELKAIFLGLLEITWKILPFL